MTNDQIVRLQFLEEAQAYLERIESELLGVGFQGSIDSSRLNALLRAAHSLKGGGGMMGYSTLSHLAHRLEDFFKVIQARQTEVIDEELESLLLSSVDSLRHCISYYRQGSETLEETWLETSIYPVFEQLHQRLGDPIPEDAVNLLSEEAGGDISVLLFETEVEGCLQRLESVLADPEQPCLREEFLLAAQELGGLGEMLDLQPFIALCTSIHQQLESSPDERMSAIAHLVLQTWRRSQALVLIGQTEALPDRLELESISEPEESVSYSLELDALLNLKDVEIEDFSFLSTPESEFSNVTEPIQPIASPISEVNPQTSELLTRVSARQLEQLSELFGELLIERNSLNLQFQNLRHLALLLGQRVKILERSNLALRSAYDQSEIRTKGRMKSEVATDYPLPITHYQSPNFDVLEMDRYSDFHLLFQNLMETIVQIQEVTSDFDTHLDTTQRTARDLTRTTQLMQNQLTQVCMQPLSDLMVRFPRALRDMSLKYGKQVEMKITGGSTLIDRTVLETLNEPLLHLLRNAFDHGIEDPATRTAQGKPPQGLIEINATYRGNQAVITIRDDGAGIDLDKIRTKALQMGLDESDLAKVSSHELLDLIFEPGFSTAEQVTDLSGRGVGMDVVRTNLEKIRGKIHVDTQMGVGTTFTVTVPFTLSIIRVLLVECAGMLLAFPTNAVETMLLSAPEIRFTQAGEEFFNWEDANVPLIGIQQWLRFSRSYPKSDADAIPTINQPTILIMAHGSERVGLQVDRYWGEQEVTIRPIEGVLQTPLGFTSCTILGDGRVVPLVDAPALLSWIEQHRSSASSDVLANLLKQSDQSTATSVEQKTCLMVVDDSINVRRFVALTLEKAGYRVEQAKDGQDALEKLEDGLPIKGVICDIEMPRLDGYGFLGLVKSNPKYKTLPVIMLTSRSGDKHRQIAMNLGATAYFSKPFQEQELLQTLKNICNFPND